MSHLPPTNVSFSLATVVSGESGQYTGTNLYALPEPGSPPNNGAPVWFSWTPPNSGSVAFSTLQTGSLPLDNPTRTFLQVFYYTGSQDSASVNMLTEVDYLIPTTFNQQAFAGMSFGSILAWQVTPADINNGIIYYCRVDGAFTKGLDGTTPVNGGVDYAPGDILYPTGGDGIIGTLTVDTVNSSGSITSLEITTPGAYVAVAPFNSNFLSASTGMGHGAVYNLGFGNIPSQGDFYLSWGNYETFFYGTCNGDQPTFGADIKCVGSVIIPDYTVASSSTSFGSFPKGLYKMEYSRGAGIVNINQNNYCVNSVWFVPGQTATGGTIGPFMGISINNHNLDPMLEPDIQHFDYPPQPSDGFSVTHFYNSQVEAETLNKCYNTQFTQDIAGDISLMYACGYSIDTPATNFMLDNPGGVYPQFNPIYSGSYSGQGAGDICNPFTPISGSQCTYIVDGGEGFITTAQIIDNGDNNPSYTLFRYFPNLKVDMGCVFWASVDDLGNPDVPAQAGTTFTLNWRLNNLSSEVTWPAFTASLSGDTMSDTVWYGGFGSLPPGDFGLRFIGSASSADTHATITLTCPYWDAPLSYTYYIGPIYNDLVIGSGLERTSEFCSSSLDTGSHRVNNIDCTWTNQGYWNVNPSASYTLTTAQGNPFILAQSPTLFPYSCVPITEDGPFFTEEFNCVSCFCYSAPAHITDIYNPTVTQSLTLHIASNIYNVPTTCSINLFDGALDLITSEFGVQLLN